MSDTHVGTWLDDHLAVAVGALELARRCRRENGEQPWSDTLDTVVLELEAERTSIDAVIRELGTSPSRWKQAAGWLAEKIGRLNVNDKLLSYTPLTRLEEIEALLLAVASLGVMWRSLQRVRGDRPGPDGVDVEQRAGAMESLLDELRALVGAAADQALAPV